MTASDGSRASLLILGLVIGCSSMGDKLRRVHIEPCDRVLADAPAILADPDYAAESRVVKEDYEVGVANCHLQQGDSRAALDLAKRWSMETRDRHMITARAMAAQKNPDGVREALGGLASNGGAEVDFFLDDAFDPYRRHDWFVSYAVTGWDPERDMALERFLGQLLAASRERLLPMRLAAADPGRPGGEWVLWLGVVQQGKLDRDQNKTLLYAEGAEVKDELRSSESRVASVETESTTHLHRFGGVAWATSTSTATPTYGPSLNTFEEVFVPNGHRFVVRLPGIREAVATWPAVFVLGRYQGLNSEGQLLVDALLIQPRQPRVTSRQESP